MAETITGKKTGIKRVTEYCVTCTRYSVSVLGAWSAELVTYPLDLMRTRLQIQSEIATAKHGHKMEHMGMIKTGIAVVQREGPLALWAGMTAILQRHAAYAGVRLVLYEYVRKFLEDEHKYLTMPRSLLTGAATGGIAQFIANPMDVVKIRMQAEGRRKLQGMVPHFKTVTEAYLRVFKESGIRGFYRGAVPNVQRAIMVNIGDLATYDYTKKYLMRNFNFADNYVVHMMAAVVAGFAGAALGTPADLLKTRLMNQPVRPDGTGALYKGMIDCARISIRNEGLLALYKGFFPMWLRLGPWALVYWLTFESIMILIGGKTF